MLSNYASVTSSTVDVRLTVEGIWWETDHSTRNAFTGKQLQCRAHLFVRLAKCKGCPRGNECQHGYVMYELQSEHLSGKACTLWYTRAVSAAGTYFGADRLEAMNSKLKECHLGIAAADSGKFTCHLKNPH